jgi:hypothetical protein
MAMARSEGGERVDYEDLAKARLALLENKANRTPGEDKEYLRLLKHVESFHNAQWRILRTLGWTFPEVKL